MSNVERSTTDQAKLLETLAVRHEYAVLMPYSQNLRERVTTITQRLSFYSAFATNAVAELYKAEQVKKIILCGETTFGQDMKTTSDLQKEALVRMGIPDEDIIVLTEPNLDNTAVQIRAVARFQKRNKLTNNKFLVVDWGFHDQRVNNHIKGFRLNAETIVAEDVHKLIRPKFNQRRLVEVLPAEFEEREKTVRKISKLDRVGLIPRVILKARGASVTDIQKSRDENGNLSVTLENTTGKRKLEQVKGLKAPEHFDAVVVLGKNIGVDYSPQRIRNTKGFLSPHSKINVIAAGDLYRAGLADKIIFSTGHTAGDDFPSEADAMERYLLEKYPEIPEEAIILEENSLDTWENAKEVKKILAEGSMQNVALLTVGFHLRRAKTLFESEGIQLAPFSADKIINQRKPKFSQNYAKTRLVRKEDIKEAIAFAIQLVPGGKQLSSRITHATRNPNR